MYFCACKFNRAAVAQLVEHQLPKLRVRVSFAALNLNKW